jgi:hypothetical protein
LRANHFKFGMIGSTDSHTGLSTADDDNFWGKMSTGEPSAERLKDRLYGGKAFDIPRRVSTASGYTGVWATENPRASLFAAMQRKEVYATTGPRITVRFFGGWTFPDRLHESPDYVRQAYREGVPMGGTLHRMSGQDGKQAPRFVVSALMDPDGARLDRVQLIKGWVDGEGELHERVINLAWSGDRASDVSGKLPPLGSTVDAATASWSNRIGAAQLATSWTDPDFDPAYPAFYYLRVLEIPTPRWTTVDAFRFATKRPEDVPEQLQQRAYTSPIWYEP